jgi:hypothetical protein
VMYTRTGDTITLEMSAEDYERLLILLGTALAGCHKDGPSFWRWVDFVNRLNTGNPGFQPYEIPGEYRAT